MSVMARTTRGRRVGVYVLRPRSHSSRDKETMQRVPTVNAVENDWAERNGARALLPAGAAAAAQPMTDEGGAHRAPSFKKS